MGCGGSKKDTKIPGPTLPHKDPVSNSHTEPVYGNKTEEKPDEEAVVITQAKAVKKKTDDFRENNEEPKAPIIVAKRETPAIVRSGTEEIKVKPTIAQPSKENIPIKSSVTLQQHVPRPPSKLPPLAEKPNFPNEKPDFNFDFLEEDKTNRDKLNHRSANDKIVIVDQLLEEFNDI